MIGIIMLLGMVEYARFTLEHLVCKEHAASKGMVWALIAVFVVCLPLMQTFGDLASIAIPVLCLIAWECIRPALGARLEALIQKHEERALGTGK